MTRDKVFKWIGTVNYMTGIALTAANFYPYNLAFQAAGAVFWVAGAVVTKDIPLGLLEGYALISYGGGLGYAAWLMW